MGYQKFHKTFTDCNWTCSVIVQLIGERSRCEWYAFCFVVHHLHFPSECLSFPMWISFVMIVGVSHTHSEFLQNIFHCLLGVVIFVISLSISPPLFLDYAECTTCLPPPHEDRQEHNQPTLLFLSSHLPLFEVFHQEHFSGYGERQERTGSGSSHLRISPEFSQTTSSVTADFYNHRNQLHRDHLNRIIQFFSIAWIKHLPQKLWVCVSSELLQLMNIIVFV